jgi:hypothetical protein
MPGKESAPTPLDEFAEALVDQVLQYFEIVNDVDGYIGRGGKLLDLVDLAARLPSRAKEIALEEGEVLDPQAASRFGEFLMCLGGKCEPNERIRDAITEERARAIWHGTAPLPVIPGGRPE